MEYLKQDDFDEKKKHIHVKVNEEDIEEKPVVSAVSLSDLNDETIDTIEIPVDSLKTVFIPKSQHEHFECIVDKHVYIDKPWTKISRAKILEDLRLQKTNSCFWKLKKKLEAMKNENVLVGYKSFNSTDEEFSICISDKHALFIEELNSRKDKRLKEKVELSTIRTAGPWKSNNSEYDIDSIKPVSTRKKIKSKWLLPSKRCYAKAEFQDSNSKFIRNQYVKLEPRSKEVFECSDLLITDSYVQAVRKCVGRETQTITNVKIHKCLQSVSVEEDIFQIQELTAPNKFLTDFFEKHIPNLNTQIHYNNVYDDNFKDYAPTNDTMIRYKTDKKNIKLHNEYQFKEPKKMYASCQIWHPTIPGIFAVSYAANSMAVYTSGSLETPDDEITKSVVKDETFSYIFNDNNAQECLKDCSEVNDKYYEKRMSLLNKEFVQRMRMLQLNEDEKSNDQFIDTPHEQQSMYSDFLVDLDDKNHSITDDEMTLIEENGDTQMNSFKEIMSSIDIMLNEDMDLGEDKMQVDHHESDTDSFYNIWGDDNDWLYGNKLRKVVRHKHRMFNKKYCRAEKQELLCSLLNSETKYTEKRNETKTEEKVVKEGRMELAKDMFEASDMYSILKSQPELKSYGRKNSRLEKNSQNNENIRHGKFENNINEQKHPSKENEQKNVVLIWSILDHMTPVLILKCPDEMNCIKFNPRDGNTVVGGLTNGQICIWDITGKLEKIYSDDNTRLIKEEEYNHRKLWLHMTRSLEKDFETKIKPTANSCIMDSHEASVTEIQWIHPMNEVTPLGTLVTTREGQYSDQFFTSSLDGTIKLWDLHAAPPPISTHKSAKQRFGHPENLNKYHSPLSVYDNFLKPTYTIRVTNPENVLKCSPVTAMDFLIPSLQYNYTSDQPLVIGKRQFEYVPTTENDVRRILVIGNIMGQVSVITWDGFNKSKTDQNTEECKYIWWGHVHDGPINSIRRNAFFEDIYLVCGGHVVSVWSLNYGGGPIWWNRFDDLVNSILWSTIHPAQFRVSFSNNGVVEFWDFMKLTQTSTDKFHCASVILAMSSMTTPPIIKYTVTERLKYAGGMNQLLDYEKNELITFSNNTGGILLMTIAEISLGPSEIEEARHMFLREVNWRKSLDISNERYRQLFGSVGENSANDFTFPNKSLIIDTNTSTFDEVQKPTGKKIMRRICNELYRWYSERRGPKTRLGKLRAKYVEREKQHTIEMMMEKKNITKNEMNEYFKTIEGNRNDEGNNIKITTEADATLNDIVKKLLAAENPEEHVFEKDSKKSITSEEIKNNHEEIRRLLVTDIVEEKEKLMEYIGMNLHNEQSEIYDKIIKVSEKENKKSLDNKTLFKISNLRSLRMKFEKNYSDEDYIKKEQTSRKPLRPCVSGKKIKTSNATFVKCHEQPFEDAMLEADDEHYEQPYDDNYY